MNCPACHHRWITVLFLLLVSLGGWSAQDAAANVIELFQARNGAAATPKNPVEWVKGNAGPANSHYFEGFSVPYRVVITYADSGRHYMVLEWETLWDERHAIDYLTHYNRLQPHGQFGGHTLAESIDPLDGVEGSFGAPSTFPIPVPSTVGSRVAGQPAASFAALPVGERALTIWNGVITNAVYEKEMRLDGDSAISRLRIDFIASGQTVVIAFGGHIASRADWGAGNSASSISGSPYHMRLNSFDGQGGNQDRSLQALAVVSPPSCIVLGPDSVCAGTTNTYTITNDGGAGTTYRWSLTDNTSGAFIVGSADGPSVRIASPGEGTFGLGAAVSAGGAGSSCARTIQVNAATTATPLAGQVACLGSTVTFRTTPSGTGPFRFVWRKGENVIAGATNAVLTLETVAAADAGIYCVEVTGDCGTVTQCASLLVEQAPALTCPPDLAVQCLADVPPPAPESVVVTGGSGVVRVIHGSDYIVTNGCGVVVARSYVAIDSCGVEAVCQQTIVVRDTIPPVLSAQPDKAVECGLAWGFDAPTALDNCAAGNVLVTIIGTVTNAQCGNTFTATRTWQATDACGNTNACSQTVAVVDTTAPAIACAPSRIVECGAVWDFDVPTAVDLCGPDVTIATMSTVTNAQCGKTFIATRTWQATDACGNTNACSQTVTVVDTTAPVIACAPSRIVECGAAWDFDAPTAMDVCGNDVAIAIMGTVTNAQCGNTFIATRTWQATDACGNTNACSQTVTVVDTTAPVIACAPSRIVECGAVWDFDAPSATDICGTDVAIAIMGTVTNAQCGNTFTATRTWQATDACGNTNACSQTVTVVDTTAPVITCVPSRSVECGVVWDFDAPTATDVCGTGVAIVIMGTVTNTQCGKTFIATRTWQATDACGNTNVCSQTVTVVDTTAPVIVCAPSRTVECGAVWDFDAPTAMDICGADVTIAIMGTVTNAQCGKTFIATRTWQATDACGNTNSCSQTVTVVDTTAPVIACAPSRSVECGAVWDFDAPTATDICGTDVAIAIMGTVTNAQCGNTFIATRTWQATDACGNTNACSQTVTIVDTTAPVITCVPSRSVECGAVWDFDAPSATDICGTDVAIAIMGTVTNAQCGNTFTATRTWQATDACGNTNACSQTVTVVDTTAPVITCLPSRTVECGAVWDFDAPTAMDICGADVTITITGTVTNQLAANLFSATRTWQATDACGNGASCSQTITVVDTTAPSIACPSNVTNACTDAGGSVVTFSASATDVCDANPQVTFQPASGSIFAIGTTTVTCVAVDASGNRSECRFTVTIQDIEPPQVVCPASFAVVETAPGSGSAVVTYSITGATDNCDTRPDVACNPPSGSTLAVGTHVVTCTATDASGNQTTCSFEVQVVPNVIVANSTADSGPGTLRQAILDANAAPGTNVIQFAFPGDPPFTIQLLSPLPPLGDGVFIDGWSQLQFTGLPVIEVNGTNVVVPLPHPGTNSTGGSVGLIITAGGTVVRGLTLNGFDTGIRVDGSGGNVIQGNMIGTDVSGMKALPNTGDGIVIRSPNNLVGGVTPSARNVVSGNRGAGIRLEGTNAFNNVVAGNFIGVAADGVTPLGNGGEGVVFSAGAANNLLGGSAAGAGNVIGYNGGSGVVLDSSAGSGNAFRGNVLSSNHGLPIDLGGDGITANDDADADAGPNNLQNFPSLTGAFSDGITISIRGNLKSRPRSTYEVEFYGGEGTATVLLGAAPVTSDDNGDAGFEVSFPIRTLPAKFVSATATDAEGNTSEFSPAVAVLSPPFIVTQPEGASSPPGGSAGFCVMATGAQPLIYQWRRNGANIPDATNACLAIPSVRLEDGGSYTVVVANDYGVAVSDAAALHLVIPGVAVGDNFVDRITLVRTNGVTSGNNSLATREAGEPLHVGKPGGKSIWYTWTAPALGIATFSTAGSTFDTLLSVYAGSSVDALTLVADDEDGSGFFTSTATFNVTPGTVYQIAIDGFGGASGDIVVNWSLEVTADPLPGITNQPMSRTVAGGSTVTFSVGACAGCLDIGDECHARDSEEHHHHHLHHEPHHPMSWLRLRYQWFFNGVAIPGATRATLTVTNVSEASVGTYTARVSNGLRTVMTDPAILQINETGAAVQNVLARDKYLDTVYSDPIRLGLPTAAGGGFQPASTVVRGYSGAHVFNTAGASTEAGEEPICGVVGGASQWISLIADETGTVFLNTDGSSYDTVIAVFTRMTNSPMLQLLACDNNGGLDGRDSAVVVPVQGGRTNFIVVDGINGATGVLRLNYSLVTPTLLTAMGVNSEGAAKVRVTGRPNLRFTIQRSTNLQNWSSLITTNAPGGSFDYTDVGSAGMQGRFYRALLLP